MASRKAIDTPFDQSEPGAYWVDPDLCMNEPPHYLPCDRCVQACEPDCIDFSMPIEQREVREVNSVIVSTGYSLLNPEILPEYGYGDDPDILTAMEFERLVNANGPTEGDILRPSDGTEPKNMLFVLCVGSRDQRACEYCSRICCMYSMKEAYGAIDHGVDDVDLLYMDIRAYGKGFDDFHERTIEEGVNYYRGRPSRIEPGNESIEATFENTLEEPNKQITREYDMVVLAPAVIPNEGTQELADTLGIETGPHGFIKTIAETGIKTTREGVYAAGCVSGPRDIPDSVSQASAASSEALKYVRDRSWPDDPELRKIDETNPRIGVFLCHCGINIAGVVDMEEVKEFADELDEVEHVQTQLFSCAGSGVEAISEVIEGKKLNRIVVAACSPKTHGDTFMRACEEAGLNPWMMTMANIRNQNSWVHKDRPEKATEKAKEQVAMAVSKSRDLDPLEPDTEEVTQSAIIVGGGVAGMSAATSLGYQGIETHLVEKNDQLGGLTRNLTHLHPSGRSADQRVEELRKQVNMANVNVHTGARLENIDGYVGNFNAQLADGTNIEAGAVVLATGAKPYEPQSFGYQNGQNGHKTEVLTNMELEQRIDDFEDKKITFVGCVGSRNGDRGCSRYCCQSMIGQAKELQENGNNVRVLYKDIRTYGEGGEELYEQAARSGVRFFQYDPDESPAQAITKQDGSVVVDDRLSGERVEIPTDVLVLSVGLVPKDYDVAKQLAVSRGEEGFLMEKHPKLGPVEASMKGIFMAGSAQAPKTAEESIEQGLGAASKASSVLVKDKIEQEPIAAQLDVEECIGCQKCVDVCPFNAIEGAEKGDPVEIIQSMCMGCGACASECPVDCIEMPYFTTDQLKSQIDSALRNESEEKAVVFACNWCSYGGADQAGVSKYQYPESCRIIRTMCSARIDFNHIEHAFEQGAGMVYVTGCHMGDCHYNYANEETQRRYDRWESQLEKKDINPERLKLDWISAAEGERFADKMAEADELLQKLQSEEVPMTV